MDCGGVSTYYRATSTDGHAMRYLAILTFVVLTFTGCKDDISSDECRLDPTVCE